MEVFLDRFVFFFFWEFVKFDVNFLIPIYNSLAYDLLIPIVTMILKA